MGSTVARKIYSGKLMPNRFHVRSSSNLNSLNTVELSKCFCHFRLLYGGKFIDVKFQRNRLRQRKWLQLFDLYTPKVSSYFVSSRLYLRHDTTRSPGFEVELTSGSSSCGKSAQPARDHHTTDEWFLLGNGSYLIYR